MQIGIIGPPAGGKSTLFHCLTGHELAPSGRIEIVHGIAKAEDDRLELVAKVFASAKTTTATVEFLDAPPVETGDLKRDSFRQVFLRGLEQTDALILVIPCFQSEQLEKVGSVVKDIETEILLCDLQSTESRLGKIARDLKRGVKGDIEREDALLENCKSALESETPLRKLEISEKDLRLIRGFCFLSLKPILIILNINEADLAQAEELPERLGFPRALPVCAALEAEIVDLPPEDRSAFLQEMGIGIAAREKILRRARDMLELLTFFTANEKEARAWNLSRGSTAIRAAGTVHSDMERGFIRAEVIHFNDLQTHPNIAQLRSLGLVHLEGKDYPVQEGDVTLFRFNV